MTKKTSTDSPKYQLNKKDLAKIGKGALIAMGGALLVYITDTLPQIEWGPWAGVAVAVGAILINAARKFIQGL